MKGEMNVSTNKPRFSVTLSDEVYKAVDDYKFEHRFKNQTQAVAALVELGLREVYGNSEKTESAPEASPVADPAENELVNIYRSLNDIGQTALMGTARGLAANPDMKRGSASNTETA
jgi:hypothetical protein